MKNQDLLRICIESLKMIEIRFLENFHKKFKKLHKKNRKLLDDIKKLEKELKANPTTGISLGHSMYKIRMANSSRNIGKSGGFRVITYFIDENDVVYLVEIYDKSAIESISVDELRDIWDAEGV